MGPNKSVLTVVTTLLVLLAGSAAGAQLLPPVPLGDVVGDIGRVTDDALGKVSSTVEATARDARSLARERSESLRALVRAHPNVLELTRLGPAVRGEIIAVDADDETLRAATAAGFRILADERVEGLDLRAVTLRGPEGLSVELAIAQLQRIAPAGNFAANHLHLPNSTIAMAGAAGPALAQGGSGGASIGIIDGGAAAHPSLSRVEQRGFVSGAPVASSHGTAVASLAVGRGSVRGAAPGAGLLIADVYGRDPRGGNALAIVRALGFMAQRGVKVVAMSLVGPPNQLVAKAVGQARQRGIHIVAAVGNGGPAAPPAYPASYSGVIAVTGVDGRNRALPEAGRSLHLDFAAPGADMGAAAPNGRVRAVRGTSFAVPLVAGRLAHTSIAALYKEAKDLGPRGPDRVYGHGLVCSDCRTPVKN